MLRIHKKVAFVIPSLEIGGAELQTVNHINYLIEYGYDVYLIVLSNLNYLVEKIDLKEDHMLILNKNANSTYTASTIIRVMKFIPRIASFICRNKINHVFAVMNLSHFVVRVVKLLNLLRLHRFNLVVYHRCAFYKEFPPNTIGKKVLDLINRLLLRVTDNRTIYISNDVSSDIESHSFAVNGTVIYNSVKYVEIDENLALTHLSSLKVTRPEFLIVFPGRFHEHKGHIEFINGFKLFLESSNVSSEKVAVILLGEGYLHDLIRKEIENNELGSYFIFAGKQEHELVLSYMTSSNLVVVPSNHEGFGNVAIEALMSRANLLASNAGGLSEIVVDGKNGILFKKGDVEDLASKLDLFYQSRYEQILNKELIFADYQERFSLENQMKKLVKLIND